MVILFITKYFLFVYMYIDLLKLKAYKLFENSDADLSWLLLQRSQHVQNTKKNPLSLASVLSLTSQETRQSPDTSRETPSRLNKIHYHTDSKVIACELVGRTVIAFMAFYHITTLVSHVI